MFLCSSICRAPPHQLCSLNSCRKLRGRTFTASSLQAVLGYASPAQCKLPSALTFVVCPLSNWHRYVERHCCMPVPAGQTNTGRTSSSRVSLCTLGLSLCLLQYLALGISVRLTGFPARANGNQRAAAVSRGSVGLRVYVSKPDPSLGTERHFCILCLYNLYHCSKRDFEGGFRRSVFSLRHRAARCDRPCAHLLAQRLLCT